MPRANSSVPRHRRHRKVVKQAKGYYGARSRTFKSAKDAVLKYAYSASRTKGEASAFLVITKSDLNKYLKKFNIKSFFNK